MVFKKERNRNIEEILIFGFLRKHKTFNITVKININIKCLKNTSCNNKVYH